MSTAIECSSGFRRLAACILIFIVSPTLHSAEWSVTDGLSVQLVYTDNLDLQSLGESGFIINAQPSLAIDGKGRRVQLGFNYSPALVVYPTSASRGDDVKLNHSLNANLSSELYRQTLFLDATATASLNTLSTQGPISSDGLNRNDNQVQSYTLQLSPHTKHRLGTYVVLENSYAVSGVVSEGSQANDSLSHLFSTSVQRSRPGVALGWSLGASHQIIDHDTRKDKNSAISGGLTYRLNAFWSLAGNVGYQDADVQTARSSTSGMTWSMSGVWTPSPRTTLNGQFSHSYVGYGWDFNLSHRARRTELEFAVSRQLTNARNFIGTESIVDGLSPSLISEDFVADIVRGGITLQGRRTTVNAGVSYDQRAYEITGLKEWGVGWDLAVERHLSSDLRGNIGVSWRYNDPPGFGTSEISQLTTGMSRSLGRVSSLGLDLQYRRQSGDVSTAYSEKRIAVNFQTKFL